jgi:hypothetical protein
MRAIQEHSAVIGSAEWLGQPHLCFAGMGAPSVESFCTKIWALLVPYWPIVIIYRRRQYTMAPVYWYARRAGASITCSSETPPVQYTRTGTGKVFDRSATDR